MPLYKIKKGDCVCSIAYEHGLTWQKVWDYPENAKLKQVRDPNILLPGDHVFLPVLEMKQESIKTSQRHRFKKKDTPAMLHLRLVDNDYNPRAGIDYTVNIDGFLREGTTDDDGCIDEPISPNSEKAILIVHSKSSEREEETDDQIYTGPTVYSSSSTQMDATREEYEIWLGNLDPTDDISGIQQRLINLGYELVSPTGQMDEPTRNAVLQVQKQCRLELNGTTDEDTERELKTLHGS